MQKKSIRKGILGLVLSLASVTAFSATIEGFWYSIDDKTGEKLSVIEIRKDAKNEYNGTIVYRYPTIPGAKALSHCTKCTGALKNKPILGMQLLTGFKDDPNKANAYIDGLIVEPKSGGHYKGKANLSSDGKRLRMRGYMGVSALGRTVVWIRTDSANP